jgi:DNA-binding CsgD family transcriptional regulator
MLGTEIKIPTFVFICVETLIFFFHLANYLSRRQDKSRFHFLTLTAVFIFYNICSGLLPDKDIPVHPLLQNILSLGSGILLATYYFYYLVTELEIVQEKLFRIKVLFLSLLASLLLGFICSYVLTGSIQFSRQVFIIPPILIAVYFCFLTVRFLITNHGRKTDNRPRKLMVYAGYIGVIFMASMPVVVAFGDYQILNNSLVNVSFGLACYAYMNQHLYQSKIEYEILQKIGHFNEQQNVLSALSAFNLTTTEMQVACLVVQDKTYPEIAQLLFIAPGTASKHASNIFKKTQTGSKKEFIDKFKTQQSLLDEFDKSTPENVVLQ